MVLSPKIEVRTSAIAGRGLYAKEHIAKGETLWVPDADEKERYWFTIDQIRSWTDEEQKFFMNGAYLVATDTYSGVRFGVESDKGEFMNHSCDPNCIMLNDELWVAARDIEVDDEVTYDYATSETTESSHMPFPCGCGTKHCRGTITGNDCLIPAVRERYAGNFSTVAQAFQAAHDGAAATTAAPAVTA